ncbi:MAG: Signal transduction histidine-protein kinase BarA [Sodalis sp.]|uniref:hypothetical protein n=1 Tax=Sodalis sp. (in: enterobacteria) TaxID=1898979 RepID=UPI00387397D3|nr:MAG: Signal transduction histidine-protein kinase BarA [Sodalis sp.]
MADAGTSIIEPLALFSEYGMRFHNRESVHHLVNPLHCHHSYIVRSILLFNVNNTLFAPPIINRIGAVKAAGWRAAPQGADVVALVVVAHLCACPSCTRKSVGRRARVQCGQRRDKTLSYIAIELDVDVVQLQRYKEAFISTLLLLCAFVALSCLPIG